MVIDLKSIFRDEGSLEADGTLDMSNVEQFGCFPLKKPVCYKAVITNSASVVSLKLDIDYIYDAPCDRCGEDTATNHSITFEKILAISIEGEDSDTIITVPDMKLDVDELVYSEVILDFPYKHLCSENCKGVCSRCGKNLNRESCNCNKKEIDPRLEKLAQLLDND